MIGYSSPKKSVLFSEILLSMAITISCCSCASYPNVGKTNDLSSILEGGHWKLFDDSNLSSSSLYPGHPFSIKFSDAKTVIEVKDMCQDYELNYSAGNSNMSIEQKDISLELNSCASYHPIGYLAQSALYRETLFNVSQYQITEGLLKLTTIDGKSLIFWNRADANLTKDDFSQLISRSGPSLSEPKVMLFKDRKHFEEIYSQRLRDGLSVPVVDFDKYDVIGIFFGESSTFPVNLIPQSINVVDDTGFVEIDTLLVAEGCPSASQAIRPMMYLQVPVGAQNYRFNNHTANVGQPCGNE